VIPFLPASNIFFRVGFVVAERILYIPRYAIETLHNRGGGTGMPPSPHTKKWKNKRQQYILSEFLV